jgi:Cd2+/Zn2+-exporting ATPase
MGAMGSDAAIESADIVLMDDKPSKIADSIRISRKTMRIVKENVVFALGVKALILVLGALGIANMWFAVFGDVGVLIIAILNAVRTMRVRK